MGEFILLSDFIVLETKVVVSPENEIPMIFGRPFIATSNALINYRDGKIKLTFRNMTMELNVLNLKKQHMEFDELENSTLNWILEK